MTGKFILCDYGAPYQLRPLTHLNSLATADEAIEMFEFQLGVS